MLVAPPRGFLVRFEPHAECLAERALLPLLLLRVFCVKEKFLAGLHRYLRWQTLTLALLSAPPVAQELTLLALALVARVFPSLIK
jgi:hypothetical protein